MTTGELVLVVIPVIFIAVVMTVLICHYCAKERNREMMKMITTDGFKAAEEYTEHLMKRTMDIMTEYSRKMMNNFEENKG